MYHETIKIRDLSVESTAWKKVRTSLNQCCVMIGSVSVLSDDEYRLMKDFLMTEYKDFSPEEMLIAFKKVSSGAITVDMEHFGKLSPMYLGAVLKAFKVERHKALAKELKNRKIEEKVVSDAEKLQIRKEYVNNCIIKPYIGLKHGENKFSRLDTNNLFRCLFDAKVMNPSGEELAEYKGKALLEMATHAREYTRTEKEKNLFKIELTRMNRGEPSSESGRVKQEAAHLYTVDWLKALSNADGNLEEILKENGFFNIQND